MTRVFLISVTLVLLLASCCGAPTAERYFDRGSPFNTVNGFVYAIEAGQWEFAHACLSTADRETYEISVWHLRFGVLLKEFQGVPVKDIILEAERKRKKVAEVSDTSAWIDLIYDGDDGDDGNGIEPFISFRLHLTREPGAGAAEAPGPWRIDLERSVRQSAQVVREP